MRIVKLFETNSVWPISFLLNAFTALNRSPFLYIFTFLTVLRREQSIRIVRFIEHLQILTQPLSFTLNPYARC